MKWQLRWSRQFTPCGAFFVAGLLAVHALADTTEVKDFQIHQQAVSPRALGMGNAFTAVADDYMALFYNPAGLARLEEGNLNMAIGGMIDKDFVKFSQDLKTANSADEDTKINKLVELIEANYGKHFSARFPTWSLYYARPRWGLAIVPLDLSVDIDIHKTGVPSLGLVATQDTTLAYGRGWDIKTGKGRLSVGVTGKGIYRGYFNKVANAVDLAIDSSELLNKFKTEAKEGLTVDADIGVLYSLPVPEKGFWRAVRPTFGATVRNVADYGFTTNFHLIDKASGKAPRDQRRLDLGSMFELPDWWVFKTRFAFDMRDILHENWTVVKGAHAGLEFRWKLYGWWQGGWRVGMNQGYWTAGFTGKLLFFNLDVATYGEEVGPSTQRKENRRYAAKASLDF